MSNKPEDGAPEDQPSVSNGTSVHDGASFPTHEGRPPRRLSESGSEALGGLVAERQKLITQTLGQSLASGVVGQRHRLLSEAVGRGLLASSLGGRQKLITQTLGQSLASGVVGQRHRLLSEAVGRGLLASPVGERQRLVSQQFGLLAARPAIESIQRQREQLLLVARRAAESALLMWPENLRDIPGLHFEEVDDIIMGEGIPLYAVPRTETAEMLLRAGSFSERRAILGSRWRGITTDCEALLSGLDGPGVQTSRRFAQAVAAALRDGHPEAAQALAANLLETLVNEHFQAERVVLLPSRDVKTPHGYEDFIARKYLALAPIWTAFQPYFIHKGDKVPRAFARHASAHSVTSRQFSRRNAVQGLMLVTGLLSFVTHEDHAR